MSVEWPYTLNLPYLISSVIMPIPDSLPILALVLQIMYHAAPVILYPVFLMQTCSVEEMPIFFLLPLVQGFSTLTVLAFQVG